MRLKVSKEFTFDAAHHLTQYYGKCEKPHGHTYKLIVTVSGESQANGMVVDFVILKHLIKRHILNKLDHHDLNEHFENPTAENIAQWIWTKLQDIDTLLLQELNNPNLAEEIKYYLKDPKSKLNNSKQNAPIQLEKITLYETATSSVTIQR